MTNLMTPHALLLHILLQSCSQFDETGSDNQLQRHIHSKFSKMACGLLLDLVQLEVETHDTPNPKAYSRNKHDVDQVTHGAVYAPDNVFWWEFIF